MNPRRAIVFGAAGLLGRQIVAVLHHDYWHVDAFTRADFDIADATAVRSCITSINPAAVINCAGITHVDGCESREKEAMQINGHVVAPMAAACNETGATFVYISTDYVFDGQSRKPWCEDDTVNPLNTYARSKLCGENETRRAKKHLIIRTAWLFGPGGNHFVATILKKAAAGDPMKIVNDQTGSPSYAPDVARALADLLNANAEGIVHVTNASQATWFELAQKACQLARINTAIEPIPAAQYQSPAKRPTYSVLNTNRLNQLIGRHLRPWQDALAEYIETEGQLITNCKP